MYYMCIRHTVCTGRALTTKVRGPQFNSGWLPVFHSSLNIFPSLSSRTCPLAADHVVMYSLLLCTYCVHACMQVCIGVISVYRLERFTCLNGAVYVTCIYAIHSSMCQYKCICVYMMEKWVNEDVKRELCV